MATLELEDIRPFPYKADKADNVKFASGLNLTAGTVVAQKSSNFEWVAYDPNASDGSEEPRGILLRDADTSVAQSAPVAFSGIFGSQVFIPLSDSFTGDGTTTDFNLTREPFTDDSITVTVDGTAVTSGWSISGSTIHFDSAPASGANIVVTYKGKLNEADKQKLRDKGMVVKETEVINPA